MVAGYQAVDCPYCHNHGIKPWKSFLDEASFKNSINEIATNYLGRSKIFQNSEMKLPITIVPDQNEKDFIRFYKNGDLFTISKTHLRKVLGRKILPSNNFHLQYDRNGYRLSGEGNGHGVGMCQFGALELAKRGYNYEQILAHYFPGHVIDKIY